MRNYIALAVPFFFLLIGAEVLWGRAKGVRTYRFNDVLVNLASGTGQQVATVFCTAGMVAIYAWVYDRTRLINFPVDAVWTWAIAFVLVDFKYYWWHRLSHEVNFLWAAHVTHHSSEDYNLSVALRQSITTLFTSFPFALALAVLGVPVVVFVALESFSLLYQFWIHTELMGKLGWYERLFNTPSQHRVHHAINPRYLDKNYAGTLCIWDRIFGTFEEEKEAPVYGLVHPLGNFNPLWAQFHYYVEVAKMSAEAPRARDKFLAWVKGPLWRPEGMPPVPDPPEVTPETRAKYEAPLGDAMRGYLGLQLVATMTAGFFMMMFQNEWPRELVIALAVFVSLSLITWGGILEKRAWAVPLDLIRLIFFCAAAGYFLSPHVATFVLALVLAGAVLPQLGLLWAARGAVARDLQKMEETRAA